MRGKNIKLLITASLLTLLISGCTQIEPKAAHKYSELHTAVRLGQLANVQVLANENNINIKDAYNETPLIDSVRNNNTEISFFLICMGADTSIKDYNNYSLEDMAIRNENKTLVELLSSKNKKDLCSKPIKKDVVLIKTFLKKEMLDNVEDEVIIVQEDSILYDDYQNNFEEEAIPSRENLSELLTSEQLDGYKNDKKPVVKKIKEIKSINFLKKDLSLIPLQKNNTFDINNLTFTFYNVNKIDTNFKNKLSRFIPNLISVIKKNKEFIKEIKIKTYTSSEYRNKTTIIGKFMQNLKVSEERSNKVLQNIVDNLTYEKENIKKIFVPVGMSSQNLIKRSDGSENKEMSRRIEFEIIKK